MKRFSTFHIKNYCTFAKIKFNLSKIKIAMSKRKVFSVIAIAAIVVFGSVSCKKPVTSVTLDKITLTLVEGEFATLTATVLPENAANKAITWSSDKPAVSMVLPNGLVSALSKGIATITVTTQDGSKTANCMVIVKEIVPVVSVTLNKSTLTLDVGGKETLIATVLPENAANKAVTWSSDKPAVATVVDGLVTAKADGEAIITVTTKDGNKTANCNVKVGKFHPAEPEMVFVEGGTFTMGCTDGDCNPNELPTHQITLNSFKIAKYPITQKQWVAIMGNNPSHNMGDNLPVENVNWSDAQEFIRRLNDSTGKQYRLATEAEWEYAARGGNKSQGYNYSGSNDIDAVAWYMDNSGSQIRPVGTKTPNELGIYDMSGNVWEWCSDWYEPNYYTISPQNNPQGPASSSYNYRIGRGGDSKGITQNCRVALRGTCNPSYRKNDLGFRLAHP
jgi:formylglycine-generating enzyme required for sulfatase activity